MASPTPNKGMTYPAHGGAVNAWDSPLNANFDQIDQNVGGVYNITCGSTIADLVFNSSYATASSTVATITFTSSIAQNLFYPISGAITQDTTLVYPGVGSFYILNNTTSGGFLVKAKTAASATTITVTGAELIVTDGTSPFGVIPAPTPEFASGTALLFPQTSPPSGWTRDTTLNDRLLRIVSSAGTGTGGSWTISGLTVGNHTLTTGEMPGHNHPYTSPHLSVSVGTGGGGPTAVQTTEAANTGNAGGDGAHGHSMSADGNWRPLYYNIFRATKN